MRLWRLRDIKWPKVRINPAPQPLTNLRHVAPCPVSVGNLETSGLLVKWEWIQGGVVKWKRDDCLTQVPGGWVTGSEGRPYCGNGSWQAAPAPLPELQVTARICLLSCL